MPPSPLACSFRFCNPSLARSLSPGGGPVWLEGTGEKWPRASSPVKWTREPLTHLLQGS